MGVLNKLIHKKSSDTSSKASTVDPETHTPVPTDVEKPQETLQKISTLPVPEDLLKEKDQAKAADDDDEDDTEYPTAWKLGLITTALCLSVFCMALDNTIIATAIPKITDQFKAINDVGW